ncbi:MAG: YceI family protein [Acidobacteriia bacterium]|nr:YceI family protein [Terriglobia bacterium]
MAGRKLWFLPVLLLTALGLAQLEPKNAAARIDPQHSTLTVKVFKSGLFSAFGHNHEIRAPIISGSITTAGAPSVELMVDARGMQVLDPDLGADKRAEVQRTMLSAAVLDSERFPQIHFVSRTIEPTGENRYRVSGELTLHGVTRPMVVRVEQRGSRYTGSATVKQSEFGIKPVTVAGGTVQVKDGVEVVFDIATTPAQSPVAAVIGVERPTARARSSVVTATPSR